MLDLDPSADLLDTKTALDAGAGSAPPAEMQKLMQWQLDLVRDAFALAEGLNRTLVLPKLQCTCDHGAPEGDAMACMCDCPRPGPPSTPHPHRYTGRIHECIFYALPALSSAHLFIPSSSLSSTHTACPLFLGAGRWSYRSNVRSTTCSTSRRSNRAGCASASGSSCTTAGYAQGRSACPQDGPSQWCPVLVCAGWRGLCATAERRPRPLAGYIGAAREDAQDGNALRCAPQTRVQQGVAVILHHLAPGDEFPQRITYSHTYFSPSLFAPRRLCAAAVVRRRGEGGGVHARRWGQRGGRPERPPKSGKGRPHTAGAEAAPRPRS